MNQGSYEQALRAAKYILQMRPVFHGEALFSDETENYVTPMEPKPGDKVTIRFRTAHDNVDAVYLISGPMREPLEFERTEGYFDFYKIEIQVNQDAFHYYFEVRSGKTHCFFNKLGMTKDLSDSHSFCIQPGFSTPDWAKGAVMYQIFTDRFYNGDSRNDVLNNEYVYIGECTSRVTEWGKRPAAMDVREFYGGDLEGVRQKLDYLQELGVDVIYFNPLFVSPSNHKYDIQDYDYIDPHFGKIVMDEGELLPHWAKDNKQATKYINRVTRKENLEASNQLFIRLVEEAHSRGIKVILDGVFNHCGSFNKWMDRERIYENQPGYAPGAYISADSPYRTFFHFNNEHEWPYNQFYDGWWGHDTLPKLNYENSPKLMEYIMEIARKWVSPPYNADGWRLDVAADLGINSEHNHQFWRRFRKTVKEANPDALILAEHYGDPIAWLRGDEWDTVMNYDAFMEPVTWFFTGMEKHSDNFQEGQFGNADSFFGAMRYHMASFMGPSLQVAMNELSNHDHSRFLTRTNHKVGRMDHFDYDAASDGINPAVMREAVVMQMTWPGAPTIYYGDEAGVCGFTDPDNRRTYPWGEEDQQMLQFHRRVIALHKAHRVFSRGSLKFLLGAYNCLAYGRFDRREKMVIVFNNNSEEKELEVKVWPAEVGQKQPVMQIFATDAEGFSEERRVYQVERGILKLKLPATSAVVLKAMDAKDEEEMAAALEEKKETAEGAKGQGVSEMASPAKQQGETETAAAGQKAPEAAE
ncbi:MAG: glycoside hydrolase family 13 protein [Lachnospiraceae bacterium]|nr:glycoside hydrolase family 13 protein [Lachnospiraceae bacterium]